MKIRAKVSLDYCSGESALFQECLTLNIKYKVEGEKPVKSFFGTKPIIYKISHEAYNKNAYIGHAGKIQFYKDCIAFIQDKERIIEMAKDQIILSLKKQDKKDKIENLKKELYSLELPKIEFKFETEEEAL